MGAKRALNRKLCNSIAIAVAALLTSPASADERENDFEAWSAITATGPVSGPVLGYFELSIRADDRRTRDATSLVRTAVGYQIAKPLSLWMGYVRVDTRPEGRLTVARKTLLPAGFVELGHLRSGFDQHTDQVRSAYCGRLARYGLATAPAGQGKLSAT